MKRIPCPVLAGLVLVAALAARAAEAPASFTVSDVSFKRPEAWTWVEVTSPMRKAQLAVPAAGAGEAGEIVFFHFGPGNGGGTQANIERWFRQFQGTRDEIKASTEEAKAGDQKVTYVHAEGTYLSGMPGGQQTPKPGFALLGAILESPAGHIFIKFTGPKDLVQGSAPEFKKLVESAKKV